jgi:hypothetical protein
MHSHGGAIDVMSTGRNALTPEMRKWVNTHQKELESAELKSGMLSGRHFRGSPDMGHWEWGGGEGVKPATPDAPPPSGAMQFKWEPREHQSPWDKRALTGPRKEHLWAAGKDPNIPAWRSSIAQPPQKPTLGHTEGDIEDRRYTDKDRPDAARMSGHAPSDVEHRNMGFGNGNIRAVHPPAHGLEDSVDRYMRDFDASGKADKIGPTSSLGSDKVPGHYMDEASAMSLHGISKWIDDGRGDVAGKDIPEGGSHHIADNSDHHPAYSRRGRTTLDIYGKKPQSGTVIVNNSDLRVSVA